MKGYSMLMNKPLSETLRFSWRSLLLCLYSSSAVFSCWHPHLVADVLKRSVSGWQIAMIKLKEGEAGSVLQAALNLDAVILPVRIWNHNREPA